MDFSPIKGPEGNIEFLLYVKKSDEPKTLSQQQIEEVVDRAHAALER